MASPLEALTAMLGGLGTGAGQGFAEGEGAAIKQRGMEQNVAHQNAVLAQQAAHQQAVLQQQQQQFEQSRVMDMPPELANILGINSGKIPTAAFPSVMAAGEKERARQEATQHAQAAGQAYNESAALFPEAGAQDTNPESNGSVPPTQPNRVLQMFAKLSEAQAPKDPALVAWLKSQGVGESTPSQIVMDEQGNRFAVPKPKNLTGPQPVGVKGQNSSSALERAMAKYRANPTEENWQDMIVQRGLTPVQPGGAVISPIPLSGMQPPAQQPNQPMGPQTPQRPQLTAQNPVAFSQPAQPSNDALNDIADANVVVYQLKQMVDTLKSGTLDNVLGGVLKNPEGALTRGKETYLGYGMTPEQRQAIATINTQMQNVKRRLIGATRTVPEMKDIQGAVADEKSFFRGDTAEQMIPKLEAMIQNAETGIAMRSQGMDTTNIRTPAPAPAPPLRNSRPAKNNDPMGIR